MQNIKPLAGAIRALSMDAVQQANSGHPGMPMGTADVAAVLFTEFLKHNPNNPSWNDRDRFVLSAGHGSMLLYSAMYLSGYEDITIDEIKNFRQLGAKTAGHPEYGHAAGIETTTGPLGQGIANAVGMALAEKMLASRFGEDLVNHHTYVIAGDGCLMEGISQEAISFAGHLGLEKLIVFWDDNSISIDGGTDITTSEDIPARFKASNWNVISIDGHNAEEIRQAITQAKQSNKPTMIAAKTVIGFGAPNKAGTSGSHGSPLGEEEITAAKKAIDWTADKFEVPEEVLSAWRSSWERNKVEYERQTAEEVKADSKYTEFLSGKLKFDISALKEQFIADKPNMATRKSSQAVLNELTNQVENMISGSADLTGSNGTNTKACLPLTNTDFNGRYIHYGVREHGMAACMNGMALHGGFVPFSGTFLVFSDYMRPSMRLSALMQQRVIYVCTHDSIGLGEDGPTHQPVEHLAALRAIPNLNVFRPADEVEVAECWEVALENEQTPSVMSLTRQGLKSFRNNAKQNQSAKGAYVAFGDDKAKVTIMASGSEVEIAIEAAEKLNAEGITAKVVSCPCLDIFDQQDKAYQQKVLGAGIKIAVEAAIQQSWDKYLGLDGIFVGMDSFGASAPYKELYEHFGITAANIVAKAKQALA